MYHKNLRTATKKSHSEARILRRLNISQRFLLHFLFSIETRADYATIAVLIFSDKIFVAESFPKL